MPCDYTLYPANWKSEIRPAILERDKHCCKNCGVPNYALIHRWGSGMNEWKLYSTGMQAEADWLDGMKAVKIVLTISHLDNDVTNNNFENLAALCQKCHLNHDKVLHKHNRIKSLAKKKKLQDIFYAGNQ